MPLGLQALPWVRVAMGFSEKLARNWWIVVRSAWAFMEKLAR